MSRSSSQLTWRPSFFLNTYVLGDSVSRLLCWRTLDRHILVDRQDLLDGGVGGLSLGIDFIEAEAFFAGAGRAWRCISGCVALSVG
jgi:hypothetical protein